MAYVTVQDIGAYMGRALTSAEEAQVGAWLEALDAMVFVRIRDFQDRVDNGALPIAVVRFVYSEAIRRRLLNPEGLRQYTESIDDYSVTKTVDTSVSSSALYFTDDEWSMLAPGSTGDAFTISTYGASDGLGKWTSPGTWEPL